jgi:diguanylate cyclase
MSVSAASIETDVNALSEAALVLADKYKTPPTPKAYQVWFSYAEGGKEELNQRIDAMINGAVPFIDAIIESFHKEFFVDEDMDAGVSEINSRLDRNLTHLDSEVSGNLEQTESFVKLLQKIHLDENSTADHLRMCLGIQLQANTDQRRSLQNLNSTLASAKKEIQAMHAELHSLKQRASLDFLTQLYNRRYLSSVMKKEIAEAHQQAQSLCFAIADLDKFKGINDTYGHAMGDEVLKKFAQIAKDNVRGIDTVARLGGEEFAFVLPNTSLRGGHVVANRIRQYLMAIRFVDPVKKQRLERVTVSFGVTTLRSEDDPESLMQRADALLYDAKNAGRNKVNSAA